MIRKRKYFTFLLLYMLCFIFSNLSVLFAETITDNSPPEVMAESAILIDASSGQILYDKNADKKEYPASITKLMTLLLALENGTLTDTITMSHEAVFGIERGSSHIALDVGEQITLEEALYAVMLASANEAALGVAEYIDGSVSAFAERMNNRAKELGCKNTNFVNANGLHDENHYTTAYDMALIMKALLPYEEARKIMATTYHEIPPTNKQEETRYLYAQHKMINKETPYYYPDCEGGKNGFTNQALNTLVSVAQRDGVELIAVVLRENGAPNAYKDTIALFDYGFSNCETLKAFSAAEYSISSPVYQSYHGKDIKIGKASLKAQRNIFATVPKNTNIDDLTQKVVRLPLTAPLTKGTRAGKVEVYLGTKLLGTSPLLVSSPVAALSAKELSALENKHTSFSFLFPAIICFLAGLLTIFFVKRQIAYERKIRLRKKRFRDRYRSQS